MCKDFMNYSEELNDSLILTACETRLQIYNRIEAEMKGLLETEKKKCSRNSSNSKERENSNV